MNSVNIVLLLKPDKDPTISLSFSLISFNNRDLKFMCIALAQIKYKQITPHTTHLD